MNSTPSPPLEHTISLDKVNATFSGEVEAWEQEVLEQDHLTFKKACIEIAGRQTTISRSMKWLKLLGETGDEDGMICYGGFLYGLNPDVTYKRDEAALWISLVKDEEKLEQADNFGSDGSRARRHLTRLLLSGSLSKNQDSVLYQSFFHSGLREVHLLPLISKYLVEDKGERERETSPREVRKKKRKRTTFTFTSICDIYRPLLGDYSTTTYLEIIMKSDNQFLFLLPLLFSHLPNLQQLKLGGENGFGATLSPHIDLSSLQQVDTSRIGTLTLCSCCFDSLSPLSLCDWSSLRYFYIDSFLDVEGQDILKGISSHVTKSLKTLDVVAHFKDISPLADCDLSSIRYISLSQNKYLSDLSPLRGSDLSSLKIFQLFNTKVSDLSPLCECKGLALENINLSDSPIDDLSPLSRLDLSQLTTRVSLAGTKVSDLSPLTNIPYFVDIDIFDTPAAEVMVKGECREPQIFNNVRVYFN